MAKDKSKALIPCYKDIDPYDMPDEFKALQAQDMGKVGFVQDLIRGIDKLLTKKNDSNNKTVPVDNSVKETTKQIKVAKVSLEAHKWSEALLYLRNAMKLNPDCADIYLYSLLAKNKIESIEKLTKRKKVVFDRDGDYARYVKLSGNNPEVTINKKLFDKKWKYGLCTALSIVSQIFGIALVFGLVFYIMNWANNTIAQYAVSVTLPVVLICYVSSLVSLIVIGMKRKVAISAVAVLVSCLSFFLSLSVFFNAETKSGFDELFDKADAYCEEGDYETALKLYFDDGYIYDYAHDGLLTEDFFGVYSLDEEYVKKLKLKARETAGLLANQYIENKDYEGLIKFFTADMSTDFGKFYSSKIKLSIPESDYKLYLAAIDDYTQNVISHLDDAYYSDYYESVNIRYNLLHQLPDSFTDTTVIDILYKWYIEDNGDINISALTDMFDNAEIKKLLLSDGCIKQFMIGKWSNGSKYISFTDKNGTIRVNNNLPSPYVLDVKYYDIVNCVYEWENAEGESIANVFKFSFPDEDTLECYCYEDGETYTLYRQ